MQSSDSSVLILDASAFYAGIPFLGSSMCYTTNEVFDEVKHIKKSSGALEALANAGNLKVIEPQADHLKEAHQLARSSGDIATMSKADLSVLALALYFRETENEPLIVTDDYAIANTAGLAGIKISFVTNRGIRKIGRWVRYCSACGILHDSSESVCRICGNKLRAKLRGSIKRTL